MAINFPPFFMAAQWMTKETGKMHRNFPDSISYKRLLGTRVFSYGFLSKHQLPNRPRQFTPESSFDFSREFRGADWLCHLIQWWRKLWCSFRFFWLSSSWWRRLKRLKFLCMLEIAIGKYALMLFHWSTFYWHWYSLHIRCTIKQSWI